MPTTQDNAQLIVDIVSKVQAFYDTAFNHLLWTLGTMGAIIGVLVPFAIAYLQKRKLRIDRDVLSQKIKGQIEAAKRELTGELSKIIEKRMDKAKEEFNAKLEKEIKLIDTRFDIVYSNWAFSYAILMETQGVYASAIDFAVGAALSAAKSKQHVNLKRLLANIAVDLGKVKLEDIESYHESDLKKSISNLAEVLAREFVDGSYIDEVKKIQNALKAALQRK